MADEIRRIGHQFGRKSIDVDNFRREIADISANSPVNKHNLGKALLAGLQDGNCSGERMEMAKKVVSEVDSDIHKGMESPYGDVFE